MNKLGNLVLAGLVLGLAACDSVADLGMNHPSTTAPAGDPSSVQTTPSPATAGHAVAQMSAVASPRSDLVGVVFVEVGDAARVKFVMVDRSGAARSDVIELGIGASAAAGVAVTTDPARGRFYVAWADTASPPQVHLHTFGYDGSSATLSPYTPETAGALRGLGVFVSKDHLLVSGFAGSSTLFLAALKRGSGAPDGYSSLAQSGTVAPRTAINGTFGDCTDGNGCMLTVRDADDAHPSFGDFGAPAAGFGLLVSEITDSTDPSEIGKVSFEIGAAHDANEAGDFPRIASDGARVLTMGVAPSGQIRVQGAGRACGAVTLRGCESPSDTLWRHDYTATELGGNASSVPVAVSADASTTVFALTNKAAGDTLVFGRRGLPWGDTTSTSSSPSPSFLPSIHTLGDAMSGDPVLVQTSEGWAGLWIEGTSLFVRGL